jgi:hypothetical protein
MYTVPCVSSESTESHSTGNARSLAHLLHHQAVFLKPHTLHHVGHSLRVCTAWTTVSYQHPARHVHGTQCAVVGSNLHAGVVRVAIARDALQEFHFLGEVQGELRFDLCDVLNGTE